MRINPFMNKNHQDNSQKSEHIESKNIKGSRVKAKYSLSKGRRHKGISIFMAIVLVVSVFPSFNIMNMAADVLIDWRENDVMDTGLEIVNNKAGADDLLFEIDVEDTGSYELEYYLEDTRKTIVYIDNNYDELNISFKVQEYGTPATEITQDLIDASYLYMDYDATAPTWVYSDTTTVDAVTETLDFTIDRSASTLYPGIAFQMDNKMFIAKWDFQEEILYVLFDSYVNGQIMPVTLTNPDGDSQTIKILKGLEDFTVEPTHLIEDPDDNTQNIEYAPVEQPNDDGTKPGDRPGLRYNFKQPMELDETDWSYGYDATDLNSVKAVFEIEDVSTLDYLDFNMYLQGNADQRIYEIPSENGDQDDVSNAVTYTYDAANYEYEVLIVADKSVLADDTKNTIIEWNDLASSRIYNTSIGFQIDGTLDDYEFAEFTPEDNFAYTYLEYELERSDKEEAFLELTPYQLGSEEEIEYTVLYSKLVSTELDPVDDIWLKHYQNDGTDTGIINIPVPFREESSQDAYQIIVTFSGSDLVSQVLNYKANEDLNVPPTTPTIEAYENLYVVPPDDEDEEMPQKIQFDLIWEAISNSSTDDLDEVFENLDGDATNDAVYYEVLVNDVPDLNDDNPFQVFRVYEVYKEDGDYKLRMYNDGVDDDGNAFTKEDDPSDTSNYANGYNEQDEYFRMDKISVYEEDLWTPRIDTEYDEAADTYSVVERDSVNYPDDYETEFEFPGVNYIRIRAITETDGVLGVSDYSVPISLSLSMLTYDIPIVEGITYEPFYSLVETDPMGVTLDWPAIDMTTYTQTMLEPINKEVSDTNGVTYRTYISQDKDALLNLLSSDDADYALYTEVDLTDGLVSLTQDELNTLRTEDVNGDGNILWFDDPEDKDSTADVVSVVEGLDLNNTYYIRVEVIVSIDNTVTGDNEIRVGDPSSVVSITTPIVPPEPGEEDEIPLAPETLVVELLDDSANSAELSWVIPDEITIEEDTFGFEVVAIEDYSMPDDLDDKELGIIDLIEDDVFEDRVVEGWRILYEGADVVLKKYDLDTDTWVDQDFSLITATDTSVQIIDDDNSPNRVNYYYVRTINVIDGSAVKRSTWIPGVLTTDPVQAPINLIVDYDTEYEYDGYYETVIRFDAPIADSAIIETDYGMEIYVQGEDDADYVEATIIDEANGLDNTYYAQYMGEEEGVVGYRRLSYRISGLDAGSMYDIKVRIEDMTEDIETLPDGSEEYPKSAFSDKVTTRTEFDQDEYDKTLKYEQYIEYYLTRAEELKQKPYFILGTEDDEISYKYRDGFVEGFLQLNEGDVYELVASELTESIYYFPSGMIEDANDLNVTLTIEPSDQYIGIKPYSFGEVITDEINEVLDDISDYNEDLEDYYIQLRVMVGEYSSKVNSAIPTSPLVHLEMNIIGSSKEEDEVDAEMESTMDVAISNGQNLLIYELEEELDNGIDDVILTGIVEDVLEEVADDFTILGNTRFESYLDSVARPVVSFEKDMVIGLTPENFDSTHQLYANTNGYWSTESSTYYNGRYNMSISELGSYVSAKPTGSSDLDSYFNATQIDIINKYELNQVFTSYELTNPSDTITNVQMIQTYARISGADEDSDDDDFLKAKGINVPYLSDYTKSDNEMANYLYVQVYCTKKQIDLDSVTIRDYSAIEDLSSINSSYRTTLLKGVSLGIVELENGLLNPDDTVTIEEFLDIIDSIEE